MHTYGEEWVFFSCALPYFQSNSYFASSDLIVLSEEKMPLGSSCMAAVEDDLD